MKIVSDSYKEQAKSNIRVELAKFQLKDETIIDGELITDGFLQEIGMCEDKLIGNTIAKNIELNVYNWKEINYLGQEIDFYTGLINSEGEEEYVKHGSFIVDSVEEDEEKGLLKLKALDFMIKLNQPFIDTLDWGTSRTLKEFAEYVLSLCDLDLASEDFPNANYVLTQQPAFEGYSCRYVMGKIAEISGCNVYINENNKVEIKLYNSILIESPNILNVNFDDTTVSTVSIHNNGDGSITLNGTATGYSTVDIGIAYIDSGEPYRYYLYGNNSTYNLSLDIGYATVLSKGNETGTVSLGGSSGTKTLKLRVDKDVIYDNLTIYPMVTKGTYIYDYSQTGTSEVEIPTENIILNSIMNMEISDVDYRPYNAVMIKLADGVEGENITKRDEESITQYGERTLTITANEFAINENVRRVLVEEIFDYINGFYYYPLKMTYNSYDWLERGDRIHAYYNDTNYYDTMLINHTIEFPSSIKSSIENDAVSAVNSKYEYTTETKQKFGHTEIVVDKLNQKIDSTIINVGENTDKITQILQTTDSISSQVKETQEFLNDVNNQLNTDVDNLNRRIIENTTLIEQTKQSVTTSITTTGGNNRIKNSVGYKETEFWTLSNNANVNTSQDTETEQTTISGSKFIINSGDMRANYTTIIGNSYTISFKIKKINTGTPNSISVELHRSENDYDVLYSGDEEITSWKEISHSYQATTSTPYIIFKSNGDRLEFSDFIVNDGDKQPWSQYFDEVYGKTHQLDSIGLSLSDNATNQKSKLDNNNIEFKNGNKVVAELSENRVLSNTAEIVKKIKIGNFTFEAIDDNNMILY